MSSDRLTALPAATTMRSSTSALPACFLLCSSVEIPFEDRKVTPGQIENHHPSGGLVDGCYHSNLKLYDRAQVNLAVNRHDANIGKLSHCDMKKLSHLAPLVAVNNTHSAPRD